MTISPVPPRQYRLTLLRCLLDFVTVGPLVGWVVVYIEVMYVEIVVYKVRGIAQAFFDFFAYTLLAFPGVYIIAAVPAVLTGLVYYWLTIRKRAARIKLLTTSLFGAIASSVWIELPWLLLGGRRDDLFEWQLYFLPGAISAATCSIFVARNTVRRSA